MFRVALSSVEKTGRPLRTFTVLVGSFEHEWNEEVPNPLHSTVRAM